MLRRFEGFWDAWIALGITVEVIMLSLIVVSIVGIAASHNVSPWPALIVYGLIGAVVYQLFRR